MDIGYHRKSGYLTICSHGRLFIHGILVALPRLIKYVQETQQIDTGSCIERLLLYPWALSITKAVNIDPTLKTARTV